MAKSKLPAAVKERLANGWEGKLKAPAKAAGKAAAKQTTEQALGVLAKKSKVTAASIPKGKEDEPKPLPKGFKLPKTLGAAADLLYTTREERLALNRQADEKEAIEGALKTHIIDNLPKSNASGIAGRLARVTVVNKQVPKADDWSKVYMGIVTEYVKHAKKKDGMEDSAFGLLNRALNKGAVEERWQAKQHVPGVESFGVVMVSVNKV